MAIEFREKALMAYETMPSDKKSKIPKVIEQLEANGYDHLDSYRLQDQNLDVWVVKVDESVRLLFKETNQGFLIIDIIDRA